MSQQRQHQVSHTKCSQSKATASSGYAGPSRQRNDHDSTHPSSRIKAKRKIKTKHRFCIFSFWRENSSGEKVISLQESQLTTGRTLALHNYIVWSQKSPTCNTPANAPHFSLDCKKESKATTTLPLSSHTVEKQSQKTKAYACLAQDSHNKNSA